MEEETKTNFYKEDLLKVGQLKMDIPMSLYKNHRDLLCKNIKEKLKP